MRVKLYVNTGCVGCKHVDVVEVADDTTEAELNEIALEFLHQNIDDWGYIVLAAGSDEDDDE